MHEAERQELGRRIREARTYLELSQEEVAAVLGVPRPAMSGIEAGTRGVDAIELKKLAKVLNRSLQYFTGEEDVPPNDEKVALLARAADGLSDSDMGELQRFAAYLKARSDQGE
jgi:transcriptional regulator with XRE-family HTH domain